MSDAQIAAVEIGYDILKSSISELQEGDIYFNGPSSTIGVRATGLTDAVRGKLKTKQTSKRIFSYRWVGEVIQLEKVNVKLDCYVQWNGPEVEVTFQIPADGNRARLSNDVKLSVGNPMSLETLPMPTGWEKTGITLFPVVRIPVSAFVDRPWPRSNYKESFLLVVSGLYGFGSGGFFSTYEDVVQVED